MSTPELIVKPSFPSDRLACRELWPRENSAAETIADAQGLMLTTDRLSRLAEAERIFQPTVNCYELLASHGLAIMLNQAVGAVRGKNWGSAEVNMQIYRGPDEKIQPIFVFNPYTALNPDRFSDYWQMRRGYLSRKSFDPSTWERLRAISDSLASGYVAALAQVWFLTGRVPQKFGINSGDGVYDGSLFGPKGDFPQTAPVRLITIRGGFNSQPMNKLADFLCFLAGIKDNSMIFDLPKESKLICHHQARVNSFSQTVVFRGNDRWFIIRKNTNAVMARTAV